MRNNLTALVIVSIMMVAALCPLVYAMSDDAVAEEVDPVFGNLSPEEQDKLMDEAAQMVSTIPADVSEEELEEIVTSYGTQLEQQYGVVIDTVSLGVIILLAWVAGMFTAIAIDQLADSGNPDEVTEYAQTMLARTMSEHMETAARIFTTLLPNDSNMLKFTSTYWERAIEYAISNPNVWGKDKNLDVESILNSKSSAQSSEPSIREALNNYIHTWQQAIDYEFYAVSYKQVDSIYSGDAYSGMYVQLDWGSDRVKVANPNNNNWVYCDIKNAVYTTDRNSTVYLNVTAADSELVNDTFANKIYLYSPTGENAIMKPVFSDDYRDVITLHPGVNTVSNYSSGLYVLETSGVIYAGDFARSTLSSKADLTSCLVMTDKDVYAFGLLDPDLDCVNVYKQGSVSRDISHLYYGVGYTDTAGIKTVKNVDLLDLVKKYQFLLDSEEYIIDRCVVDAEATWRIFDACESASAYVHPSTIMTVLEDEGLSADNVIVNYNNAMRMLTEYYTKYGDKIDSMEITVDPEASHVLVLGDLYCNGQLIVSGAIFTPSVFVWSESLTTGSMHQVTQSMLCTVWKQGATSFSDFITYPGTVGGVPVATLDSGCSIDVKGIQVNGKIVASYDMEVPPILYVPKPLPDPDPTPEPPTVIDSSILIIIIVLELAAIIFLLGVLFNQPVIGLIAAVAVFIIGFLMAGTLESILLGTFKWPWELW